MIYFTSDLHFGDPRLNLYGRDMVVNNEIEMDELIIHNWNQLVSENDTVYVLGDVCYNPDTTPSIAYLNGKKILVKGNYDMPIDNSIWSRYFDEIYEEGVYLNLNGERVYLNHYPINAKEKYFNIVGHIHGTWKVQRNMVNVGIDAWHFQPVSKERIAFQMNGIRNHYDANVFAGELWLNLTYSKKEIKQNLLNKLQNENEHSTSGRTNR